MCRWSDCLHPGLYIWIICILHWYHIFLTILPKVSVVSFHKLWICHPPCHCYWSWSLRFRFHHHTDNYNCNYPLFQNQIQMPEKIWMHLHRTSRNIRFLPNQFPNCCGSAMHRPLWGSDWNVLLKRHPPSRQWWLHDRCLFHLDYNMNYRLRFDSRHFPDIRYLLPHIAWPSVWWIPYHSNWSSMHSAYVPNPVHMPVNPVTVPLYLTYHMAAHFLKLLPASRQVPRW